MATTVISRKPDYSALKNEFEASLQSNNGDGVNGNQEPNYTALKQEFESQIQSQNNTDSIPAYKRGTPGFKARLGYAMDLYRQASSGRPIPLDTLKIMTGQIERGGVSDQDLLETANRHANQEDSEKAMAEQAASNQFLAEIGNQITSRVDQAVRAPGNALVAGVKLLGGQKGEMKDSTPSLTEAVYPDYDQAMAEIEQAKAENNVIPGAAETLATETAKMAADPVNLAGIGGEQLVAKGLPVAENLAAKIAPKIMPTLAKVGGGVIPEAAARLATSPVAKEAVELGAKAGGFQTGVEAANAVGGTPSENPMENILLAAGLGGLGGIGTGIGKAAANAERGVAEASAKELASPMRNKPVVHKITYETDQGRIEFTPRGQVQDSVVAKNATVDKENLTAQPNEVETSETITTPRKKDNPQATEAENVVPETNLAIGRQKFIENARLGLKNGNFTYQMPDGEEVITAIGKGQGKFLKTKKDILGAIYDDEIAPKTETQMPESDQIQTSFNPTPEIEKGQFVTYSKNGQPLEVLDNSDPNYLDIQTKDGAKGKIKRSDVINPQNLVPNPQGGYEFGRIDEDMAKGMGSSEGPITLPYGFKDVAKPDIGMGKQHFEAKHSELKKYGFETPEDFLNYATDNVSEIWKQSNGRYLLVKKNGRAAMTVVELAKNKRYYSAVTGFLKKEESLESYLKAKEKNGASKVWDRRKYDPAVSGEHGTRQPETYIKNQEGSATGNVNKDLRSGALGSMRPDSTGSDISITDKTAHVKSAENTADLNKPSVEGAGFQAGQGVSWTSPKGKNLQGKVIQSTPAVVNGKKINQYLIDSGGKKYAVTEDRLNAYDASAVPAKPKTKLEQIEEAQSAIRQKMTDRRRSGGQNLLQEKTGGGLILPEHLAADTADLIHYGALTLAKIVIKGEAKFSVFAKRLMADLKEIDPSYEKLDKDTLKKIWFKSQAYYQKNHRSLFDEPAVVEAKRSTTLTALPEEEYQRNLENEKPGIMDGVKELGKETAKTLDEYLGSISTRLENIHPELKTRMRRMLFDAGRKSTQRLKVAEAYIGKIKGMMNPEDYSRYDLARKNGDKAMIDTINQKYGITAEYNTVRKILEDLYHEGRGTGMSMGYRWEYHPRRVRDAKGFLEAVFKRDPDAQKAIQEEEKRLGKSMTDEEKAEFLNGSMQRDEFSLIDKAIRERERKIGRSLSEAEKDAIINNQLRGFRSGNINLSIPGSAKRRIIEHVDAELNKFYEDSNESLVKYIQDMTGNVEARKWFGKDSGEISKLRARANTLRTNIAKIEKSKQFKLSTKNKIIGEYQTELGEIESELKSIGGTNLDASTGAFIRKLASEGKIKASQEEELRNILGAIFNPGRSGKAMKGIKNIGYMTTLANPLSVITQAQDMVHSVYASGVVKTLPAMAKAALKKSKISVEDLGISDIAHELADTSVTGKALNTTLKKIRFNYMDRIGKESLVNSYIDWARVAAKKNNSQLREYVEKIFGSEGDVKVQKVLDDLKSGKTNEDTLFLAFNKLSDHQPITVAEVPEGYLKAGGIGKLFYMLKTYSLKEIDLYRREVFQQFKKGNVKQGLKNGIYLTTLLTAAGVGTDVIKDILSGRDFDLSDSIINNLLQRTGILSKWRLRTLKQEGAGQAAIEAVAPPVGLIDDVSRDVYNLAAKGKFSGKTVRDVPVVGRLAYDWFIREEPKYQSLVKSIKDKDDKAMYKALKAYSPKSRMSAYRRAMKEVRQGN